MRELKFKGMFKRKILSKTRSPCYWKIPVKVQIQTLTIGLVLVFIMTYLFYENSGYVLLMLPYMVWFYKKSIKGYQKKQKQIFKNSFKEAMQLVLFSLDVGFSIENSFREAVEQLKLLYGRKSKIVIEFTNIIRRLDMNENIEDVFISFAQKTEIEDIRYLAEVLRYAKRSGGDLINIIKNTIETISQKIAVDNEIQTMISGKKMEQNIMSFMPFGIILYFKISSPEFITPLYGNVVGVIIMTICFAAYMAAMLLSEKIVNIEI